MRIVSGVNGRRMKIAHNRDCFLYSIEISRLVEAMWPRRGPRSRTYARRAYGAALG
jgi:hypothetical protein